MVLKGDWNKQFWINAFLAWSWKETWRVIVTHLVTIATLKLHKKNLQISVFANYMENKVGDLPFLLLFRKTPY